MRFRIGLIAALAAAAACGDDGLSINLGTGSSLTVVNGARLASGVQVRIDGQLLGSLSAGTLVLNTDIAPGAHSVEVLSAGGGFTRSISFSAGEQVILVAYDSAGLVRPALLLDTGAVVPAGFTKLRVANYSTGGGSIDIWRTQPDFATPIRVMFPFDAGDVSPYLQSTPGQWRVLVSTRVVGGGGNPPMPDTLVQAATSIADGSSRTAVVVDVLPAGIQVIFVDP